jgi:hypothetical protein
MENAHATHAKECTSTTQVHLPWLVKEEFEISGMAVAKN